MKRTLTCFSAAVLIATVAMPRVTAAQDKPALVPLKIQIVVSRNVGEKKVSSLPYTLWVTANNTRGTETSLRMGVQVPVPSTVLVTPKQGEAASTPVASYSYRDVGTNIDCSATTVPDGWFNLNIILNDSAIQFDAKDPSRPASTGTIGVPAFRNFTSRFSILVKDGQTAQYTSATDPVSGEVLKVDLTLNVLK